MEGNDNSGDLMSYSIGFTCNKEVYSLINKIPNGFRSMVIRNAILEYHDKISDFLACINELDTERKRYLLMERENRDLLRKELARLRAKETNLDIIIWKRKYSESEIEIF